MHPTPGQAGFHWHQLQPGWTLSLTGQWQGDFSPLATTDTPAPASTNDLSPGVLRIDASGLQAWDAGLAPALWSLLAPLAKRGFTLQTGTLPASVASQLQLAWQATHSNVEPPNGQTSALAQVGPLATSGLNLHQAVLTLSFIGEVCIHFVMLPMRQVIFRGRDVLHHMDHMGPGSLPIVALTTFLVGLMLAYMGGAQLDRIGAERYIADLVTVGVVRELAALMTGVILTGRVGAAIAAELGTMVVNEEIDALTTLGLSPVGFLVMPRLLGMLLVAPMLLGMAMLVGVLAGIPVATGLYGVPVWEYLNQCLKALTWTHLWIGLFKGLLYTLLLVLAGCREGLYAGRNAQAVGLATTRAVVKALVWIVIAASASTAVLQSLGF